jgi:hypothetical protein
VCLSALARLRIFPRETHTNIEAFIADLLGYPFYAGLNRQNVAYQQSLGEAFSIEISLPGLTAGSIHAPRRFSTGQNEFVGKPLEA